MNYPTLLNPLLKFLIPCLLVCADARADVVAENEFKMALAYNFARYTQWPESSENQTIDFCVFDNTALTETFTKLEARKIRDRAIVVENVTLNDDLAHCELLILEIRDRKRIALALNEVKHQPVLTIGELPEFIDNGGIIHLYQERGKIRFEINPYAAQRSNLKISARLLQVAKIVGD